MKESQKFVNFLINTLVGSLIIYWLYYGLFFTPLIKDEIELIQNFSNIAKSENWDFGDYIFITIGYIFFDICILLIYYHIIIPLFITIFYATYTKIESENNKIEYLKIHFIHIVITLIFTYLLFESNYKFNN